MIILIFLLIAASVSHAEQSTSQASAEIKTESNNTSSIETKDEKTAKGEIKNDSPLDSLSYAVELFGSSLFSRPESAFRISQNVPVEPGHIVGPGDSLKISIWGKVEANYDAVIDKDGNITLPKLGVLSVSGLTFDYIKELLKREFEKYYTGFQMNVSMGSLRTIRIYVVGSAKKPGSYEVSSLSTLVNALFETGGPSQNGSLRDIRVLRQSKEAGSFDMYDFLINGDKSRDMRLMPEDVVYLTPIGPVAAIAGDIRNPAKYELSGTVKISDLIKMAGGITATAYLKKVQVERVFENEAKMVLDVNLQELGADNDLTLKDGDSVRIARISDAVVNAVNLRGNVSRPGTYQWFEGMRVGDLIKDAEKDLMPETYFEHALVERHFLPDYHKVILSINLGKALFGNDLENNISLQPLDTVTVYKKTDMSPVESVSISGGVRRPGTFDFFIGMMTSDLIKLAGGLSRPGYPASYLEQGLIIRYRPPDYIRQTLSFQFRAVSGENSKDDIGLEPGDSVMLFDSWGLKEDISIAISGAVNSPGSYPFYAGMTVLDLVNMAGGLKFYAQKGGAELTRTNVLQSGAETETYSVDIIDDGLKTPFVLKQNDYLFVKSVPDWRLTKMATINGEVKYPGTYPITGGQRISSLIQRAGGFTDRAYIRGVVFERESVRSMQQDRIDEMVQRLQREILSGGFADTATALTPDEAKINDLEIKQKMSFVEGLKTLKSSGRMSLMLGDPQSLMNTPNDIVLEDGDVLSVPQNPGVVQVVGSVFNNSSFVFDPELGVDDYLRMSGGYMKSADRGQTYVLKADGTAVKAGGFASVGLHPGDTIIVPEKIYKIAWLRDIKDITQILYQIAITAGVLIVVF